MASHDWEHIGASERGAGRAARWCARLLLLIAIAGSAQVRIRVARADPGFDANEPRRVLWSDPALLYYFTERISENGGTAPAELRADPNFQWPDQVDALAFETVGQEYVAAWWHRLFGGGQPLHVSCLDSMAWSASLTAVGVYLLAAELCGSALWGGLAALLFALLPSSYRTIGIMLLREDFALPWFALHLGLLAWAARKRTPASYVCCGLALLAALATWHAMGFVVAMKAAILVAWFLRTGRNPLAARGAWLVPAVVAVGSLLVPVLRAKTALLSLPMQAAAGLLLAAAVMRRAGAKPWHGRVAALLGIAATAGAAIAVAHLVGGGQGDYSHVVRLLLAKLRFGGALPADPRLLDFEARLLWQGPFETATVGALITGFGLALLPCAWMVVSQLPAWARGRGDEPRALLAGFTALAFFAAWLVARTEVVAGVAAPVAMVAVAASLPPRWLKALAAAVLLLVGSLHLAWYFERFRIDWYSTWQAQPDGTVKWSPHPRQVTLPRLLAWVDAELPAGAPIVADMVTSTALLAHTRHPIALQPKYESIESRRRIEQLLTALYHGTPADVATLMEKWRCRYFVVDVKSLGPGSLYLAGLKEDGSERPGPDSAAARFLDRRASEVAGFKLLWRSAPDPARDLYRVYERVDGG